MSSSQDLADFFRNTGPSAAPLPPSKPKQSFLRKIFRDSRRKSPATSPSLPSLPNMSQFAPGVILIKTPDEVTPKSMPPPRFDSKSQNVSNVAAPHLSNSDANSKDIMLKIQSVARNQIPVMVEPLKLQSTIASNPRLPRKAQEKSKRLTVYGNNTPVNATPTHDRRRDTMGVGLLKAPVVSDDMLHPTNDLLSSYDNSSAYSSARQSFIAPVAERPIVPKKNKYRKSKFPEQLLAISPANNSAPDITCKSTNEYEFVDADLISMMHKLSYDDENTVSPKKPVPSTRESSLFLNADVLLSLKSLDTYNNEQPSVMAMETNYSQYVVVNGGSLRKEKPMKMIGHRVQFSGYDQIIEHEDQFSDPEDNSAYTAVRVTVPESQNSEDMVNRRDDHVDFEQLAREIRELDMSPALTVHDFGTDAADMEEIPLASAVSGFSYEEPPTVVTEQKLSESSMKSLPSVPLPESIRKITPTVSSKNEIQNLKTKEVEPVPEVPKKIAVSPPSGKRRVKRRHVQIQARPVETANVSTQCSIDPTTGSISSFDDMTREK